MNYGNLNHHARILMTTDPQWEKIYLQICTAFANVRLGDGIGNFEANALDDYLAPEDPLYEEERARDDRTDWMSLVRQVEAWDGCINRACQCFMDAEGLRFYLPASLLIDHADLTNYLLDPWPDEKSRAGAMLALLTREQWQCLLDFYEYQVDYEDSITRNMNISGPRCPKCGLVNCRESIDREEATAWVEDSTDCQIWRSLQKAFRKADFDPPRSPSDLF